MKQQYESRLDKKVENFGAAIIESNTPEIKGSVQSEPEKMDAFSEKVTEKVINKSIARKDVRENPKSAPEVRRAISDMLWEPDKVQYHAKLEKDLYDQLILRSENTIRKGMSKPKISVNDLINFAIREFVIAHPADEFII